ncbi:MAG: hypothetical protein JXA42_10005 [Anaerolineales bacterium]|nr:hypothetical protein [Anaerolineales bacterium]
MYRKMPTEREIIEQLKRGGVSLPPLSIRLLEDELVVSGEYRFDAAIEVSWREQSVRFVVECKSPATPKVFRDGLNRLKLTGLPIGYQPLLVLPYLREQYLKELEREGISGLDLCGNGVVIAPGAFAVFRSGGENRFSYSAPIKNIYQKNSSMVSRVFLARPSYDAVQDILVEINQRNLLVNRWRQGPMSLSTVSKALKTLTEDLIVERNDTINLLQPDKVLQKLSTNYTPPKTKERVRLKLPEESGPVQSWLHKTAQALDLPLMATGTSSVTQYAVMQRGDMMSVYCPRLEMLLEWLPPSQSDRFPNLELIATEDETVYFDARQEGGIWWASPVQVYLELMSGDKRDQETAEQVKSFLLTNLGQALSWTE